MSDEYRIVKRENGWYVEVKRWWGWRKVPDTLCDTLAKASLHFDQLLWAKDVSSKQVQTGVNTGANAATTIADLQQKLRERDVEIEALKKIIG